MSAVVPYNPFQLCAPVPMPTAPRQHAPAPAAHRKAVNTATKAAKKKAAKKKAKPTAGRKITGGKTKKTKKACRSSKLTDKELHDALRERAMRFLENGDAATAEMLSYCNSIFA